MLSTCGQRLQWQLSASNLESNSCRRRKRRSILTRANSNPQVFISPDRQWAQTAGDIVKWKISSSDPDQLAELINDGKIRAIVDVRPENEFENGSIPGAMSIPFYRKIKGWGTGAVMKRTAYLAFGVVNGTEPNPDFVQIVRESIDFTGEENYCIAIFCGMGGSVIPTEEFSTGRPSRSLQAIHTIVNSTSCRPDQILHLQGGVQAWVAEGYPLV